MSTDLLEHNNPEDDLRRHVRATLADGALDDQELAELHALCRSWNLSAELADRLVVEIQADQARRVADRENLREQMRAALAESISAAHEQRQLPVANEQDAPAHAQPAAEEQLRERIRAALSNGVISSQELLEINQLRQQLHITISIAHRILIEVQQEYERQQPSALSQARSTFASEADIRHADSSAAIDLFRRSLRVALDDQAITLQEGAVLERLRQHLHISDDLARRICAELRREAISDG